MLIECGVPAEAGAVDPARRPSSRKVGAGIRVGDHIDLGVLTGELPPSLIDEVLQETGKREKRHRKLPARAVVYFVLGMCLFSGADSLRPPGYRSIMGSLLTGLHDLCRRGGYLAATSSALTQARRRLGAAPLKALFDRVRGPIAPERSPWAEAFGLRVVAWDGTTLEVPDSDANAARFGHHGHHKDNPGTDARARAVATVARSGRRHGASLGSNPLVRLMMLVECGTHAVIDGVFDAAASVTETVLATRLVDSLGPGMLLLADRNFAGHALWGRCANTGVDLLWRVKKNVVFFVVKPLPDGSFLSVMPTPAESRRHGMARFHGRPIDVPPQGHAIRVLEYSVTVTGADGSVRVEPFRLVTTLLDHRRAPAVDLAGLYAQRWESETVYSKFKTRMRGADTVLRSHSPEGVEQEIYAFLVLYQILCRMQVAAATHGHIDPDRISFTFTIRVVRARTARPNALLTPRQQRQTRADFLDELLRHRLPQRRSRQSPRQRRPPKSKYAPKRRDQPTPSTRTDHRIRITRSPATAHGYARN